MAFTYAGQYTEVILGTSPAGFAVALPSLPVNVYTVGTSTPVTLYTSRTKGATTGNPVSTDVIGNLTVFTNPGQYDLVFTPPGGSTKRVTVTVPIDPAEPAATYSPGGWPSYVSANGILPANIYDARRNAYNWKASNTRKLRASLVKAMAGTALASHGFVGDSETDYYTGSGQSYASMHPRAYKTILTSLGVPNGGSGLVWAAHYGAATQDPRWTLGANWTSANNYVTTSTAGSVMTFASTDAGTKLDIVVFGNSAPIAWSVDGGAASGTLTPTGSGPQKFTLSTTLTNTTHTVTFTSTNASAVYIIAARVYGSSGLEIHNAAAYGSTAAGASGWTDQSGTLLKSRVDTLNTVAPDVVWCALGVNDVNNALAVAATTAALTAIRGYFPSSDFILTIQYQPQGAVSTWAPYAAALYALADTLDVPLVDLYDRSGGFANSTGLMAGDGVHPLVAAQQDWGRLEAGLAMGYETPNGVTAYESLLTQRLGRSRFLPRPDEVDAVMASPPTVAALATATAIGSAINWPSVTTSGTASALTSEFFAYRCAAGPVVKGTSFPDGKYVTFTSLTTTNTATAPYCADFMFDGTTLEIQFKGLAGFYRLRVDGELVSATPGTVTNTGSTYFLPITFASRRARRITFESSGLVFGGVTTGPNDTVWKPSLRSPRVIVLGASYTEGTGSDAGAASNWVRKFSEHMGWLDTWASGVGGTGYLNPGVGGRVKVGARLANDCTQWAPDIVIWAGDLPYNDYAGSVVTAAQVQAEALADYQAVQSANPNAIQIAFGPWWHGGVENMPVALLDFRDAVKAAAAAAGIYFLDILEMPLGTVAATTLSSGSAVSATSLSVAAPVPIRSTIEVGTGSTRERRVVTNVSGTGPYTLTVAAMANTHSAADPVTQVGPSFWTGAGHVGATTGAGNSDLYVFTDGIHPAQAGHDALGALCGSMISRQVLTA